MFNSLLHLWEEILKIITGINTVIETIQGNVKEIRDNHEGLKARVDSLASANLDTQAAADLAARVKRVEDFLNTNSPRTT